MSAKKIRKIMSENREFKERWEIDYMFVKQKEIYVCLICRMNTTICKEYNLKRHYQSLHADKYSQYNGESRTVILENLKKQFKQQTSIITFACKAQDASVYASYAVAKEIAKAKKPFTDGEIIKKCAIKMAQAFGDDKMAKQFESISLSHQTVARRILNMDTFLVEKLADIVKNCIYFSIALDESTDISHTSQMLIFVRTVDVDFNVSEELLKLASLHSTTKGVDIYEELKNVVCMYGGFEKCTAIVTDGAKSMVGKNIGLARLLKQNGINCQMLHCIIHQQALCGNIMGLSCTMSTVIKITNAIRGGNRALTHRKFKQFLEELDAEYGDLL